MTLKAGIAPMEATTSRAAPSVEAHQRVNGPDKGKKFWRKADN